MSKLAANIHAQPDSLPGVLAHHIGDGAAALAQAASLLRSKKKIVITGMGASLFASIPLRYQLALLNLDATLIEAGELLHFLHSACNDAVVLVVSRSGESVEIAKLLTLLKGSAPIVGVTNEPASLLSTSADVSIHLASLKDEMVAVQTYTATLVTLHLLGSQLAGSLSAAAESVRNLLPHFRTLLASTMANLGQWDSFLQPYTVPYLLARGASLASAQEGALLFHEVAKCPAVATATASFRHGPVEVVDPSFRGFVFAPQDSTAELNVALARDLIRFGGEVRLLGYPTPATKDLTWCALPAVPATLAPLFEIVPLQAAALRLAELRRIPPGSFRFAPQVALDESSFSDPQVSR